MWRGIKRFERPRRGNSWTGLARAGIYSAPVHGREVIETQEGSTASPQEARGGRDGETPPGGAGGAPLLVVRAGDYRCGFPVGTVREVVKRGKVTRIPEAKPPFRGLLSLRGEVVTVLDLAVLAARAGGGGAKQETTGSTTGGIRPQRVEAVVILRGGKDPLGLEVDGVEEIRDLPPAPEGPAAPGSPRAREGIWAGAAQDGPTEVGVLDAERVFAAADALAAASAEPAVEEVPNRG